MYEIYVILFLLLIVFLGIGAILTVILILDWLFLKLRMCVKKKTNSRLYERFYPVTRVSLQTMDNKSRNRVIRQLKKIKADILKIEEGRVSAIFNRDIFYSRKKVKKIVHKGKKVRDLDMVSIAEILHNKNFSGLSKKDIKIINFVMSLRYRYEI